MSKIINGIDNFIKEANDAGLFIMVLAILPIPTLIFSANKDGLYMWVLAAYVLAVGFAVVQWDRGQYKQSNGYQIGMAVFLVFAWSLIGNNDKWAPLFMILDIGFFIMQFYFWLMFFISEHKVELRRITL